MPDEEHPAPATRRRAGNRAAYSRWQAFCDSRTAIALMFLWALAEATVWPVIPDALLVLLAAGARHRYGRILLAAILGSALGGILTYLSAYMAPERALALLPHLPLVQPFMIDRAHALLDQQGALAFLRQPWSGIAFKIFAVLAGARGIDPLVAIPLSIAARSARMAFNSAVVAVVARAFPRFFGDFWIYLVLGYLVLFGYTWWRLST